MVGIMRKPVAVVKRELADPSIITTFAPSLLPPAERARPRARVLRCASPHPLAQSSAIVRCSYVPGGGAHR